MMRKLFVLLRMEFIRLWRTPALAVLFVLFPLAIIGIVPLGLSGNGDIRIQVLEPGASSDSLAAAEQRMDRGEIQAIVIPAADGEQDRILCDGSHAIIALEASWKAMMQLYSSEEDIDSFLKEHVMFASGKGSTHYYLVPLLLLLLAVSGCCMASNSVVTDLESKRLEHLLSVGLNAPLYLVVKGVFCTILGMFCLAVGLVTARLVYGLSCAGSFPAFLLLSLCFLVAAANLGILVAFLCRNQTRSISVLVFLFIVLSLLSTMFVPVDNMLPAWAATRYANPFYWHVDGAWKVMLKGAGLRDILPHCFALLGMWTLFIYPEIVLLRRMKP